MYQEQTGAGSNTLANPTVTMELARVLVEAASTARDIECAVDRLMGPEPADVDASKGAPESNQPTLYELVERANRLLGRLGSISGRLGRAA